MKRLRFEGTDSLMKIANALYLVVAISLFAVRVAHAEKLRLQDIEFVYFNLDEIQAVEKGNPNNPNMIALQAAHALMDSALTLDYFPSARIDDKFDEAEPICTPAKVKNRTRESKYLFSHPTGVTSSLRLYSRNKFPPDALFLNEQGQITSLESVFNHVENFTVFTLKDRSYGGILDAELNKLPANSRIEVAGLALLNQEVAMFAKGRSNFLIEAPYVLAQDDNGPMGNFFTFEFAAVSPFLKAYMMCNKTEETRIYIENLNKTLVTLYQNGVFFKITKETNFFTSDANIEDMFERIIAPFVEDSAGEL